MNEQHNEQIMIRYLQGTCSPEEKSEFEAWLQESTENRKQFYETRLLWHASNIEYFSREEPLNKALATFNDNILLSDKRRRKSVYLQIVRYAAIVTGALVITWMILLLSRHKPRTEALITSVVSHTDSSQLVVLSDGTRVWLNSNSRITYPRQFTTGNRTVIFEGEAYFDVTHDEAHPFIVHTATMDVKVLGTAFNVQAYPHEHQAEAVLVRGKIAIADSLGRQLAEVAPGQIARFDKTDRQVMIKNVNPDAYTGWRFGQITLPEANLATITRKLAELYPVHFSIEPSITDTARYNFIFSKRKPVTEVMDMLRFIAPIHYQVQGTEILITKK
jgi:ferric-dicitrate binding protein FerR (iron transport regulator)